MAEVKNACAGPFGAFYDAWIERKRVAAVVGRVLWGIDTSAMYPSMRQALGTIPDGSTVIDVPCGAESRSGRSGQTSASAMSHLISTRPW